MLTAPKGRTHGSTDQACDVKIFLANPEAVHAWRISGSDRFYPITSSNSEAWASP